MVDTRHCDQCGRAFEPRREHARFCSGECRVAWNREHRRDPATELRALDWSVASLDELGPRLAELAGTDRGRAASVVGEAVWQVTIVDATLVRYHPDIYDEVLARLTPARRRLIEGTMGGLRFVRNRMRGEAAHDDFVGPPVGGPRGVTGPCTWQPVAEPAAGLPRSARRLWELSRYRAYQDYLVGHPVTEAFGRAADFLRLAGAALPPGLSAPTGR